jgi:hypothetical protein
VNGSPTINCQLQGYVVVSAVGDPGPVHCLKLTRPTAADAADEAGNDGVATGDESGVVGVSRGVPSIGVAAGAATTTNVVGLSSSAIAGIALAACALFVVTGIAVQRRGEQPMVVPDLEGEVSSSMLNFKSTHAVAYV